MKSVQQKKKEIAEYMERVHMYYINHVVQRPASAADLALWMGMAEMTLSRLKAGKAIPKIDNIILIANRMGPEIFDILEMPRLMPQDEGAHKLIDEYFDTPPEDRKKLLDNLREWKRELAKKAMPEGGTLPAVAAQ